jgi:hypothetical protein
MHYVCNDDQGSRRAMNRTLGGPIDNE